MKNPSVYAKAFTAAATALGTGVVTAASDGVITLTEWVVIVSGVLAAAAATYVVPNRDPEGEHQESVQPPGDGMDLPTAEEWERKAAATWHPGDGPSGSLTQAEADRIAGRFHRALDDDAGRGLARNHRPGEGQHRRRED